MKTPEWESYKIGTRDESIADEGATLEVVYHVVHVPEARRILEDGTLRAGLIHDESKLNKSRTSVNWLSANTWGYGSIYGTIQFSFSWLSLIENCRFYWVEAISKYNPAAYRILVTKRDFDSRRHLTAYDPAADKGPLRFIDGRWYRHRSYTSEFMIDRDIDLSECTDFDFITHNRDLCRAHGGDCKEKAQQPSKSGARLLSFLMGNDIHSIDHVLRGPSRFDSSRELSGAFDTGANGIDDLLGRKSLFSGKLKSKPHRQAVVRGALALFGADQHSSAFELLSLLKSKKTFESALEEIVNDHFQISGWSLES